MLRKIPSMTEIIIKRFWSYIKKTRGCWNWTGSLRKGYGQFGITGKMYQVHRVAYYLYYGQPKNIVMHLCDNPKCCNPRHLKDATQAENLADMARKGRARPNGLKGEDHGNSKLTEKQVKQIRKMDGTHREIARRVGVTRQAISLIKTKKRWKHI